MSSDIQKVQYKRGATVIIKDSPNPGFFYVVSEGTLSVDSGRPHLSTVTAETDASVMKVPGFSSWKISYQTEASGAENAVHIFTGTAGL